MLGDRVLDSVSIERHLDVPIQDNLKVSEHCNKILGIIKRSFTYKSSHMIVTLYKSFNRPHLEYCVQALRPHLKKDINLLEKAQHRATKLVSAAEKL